LQPELKIRSPGMIGPTRVGKISVLGVSLEDPEAPAVLSGATNPCPHPLQRQADPDTCPASSGTRLVVRQGGNQLFLLERGYDLSIGGDRSPLEKPISFFRCLEDVSR
jgi:hypothetical protein